MSSGGTMNILKTILLLRIIRIFRIFKLMRQYSALKILLYAVKASFRELLMLTIFLMLGVVIFASLIYFAERSQTKYFDNIPIGFWWAIVTMTTVGYGDTYPTTTLGYVVGTLCALCGVLVLALTIPIISNNFTLFYSHAQSRLKLPKEGKKKYEHHHWAKIDAPQDPVADLLDPTTEINVESPANGTMVKVSNKPHQVDGTASSDNHKVAKDLAFAKQGRNPNGKSQTAALLSGNVVVENLQLESAI
jgi:hypothetical protein